MVDIWYGTDFNLAKHVRPVRKTVQVEWNPYTKECRLLSHPDYFGETAIGKDLYLKYAIDKEQVDVMDKAAGKGSDKLYLWNAVTDVYTFVADVQKQIVISPDGQYLLIEQPEGWKLFNTVSLMDYDLAIDSSAAPYFISSHAVLWTEGARAYQVNLQNSMIKDIYRAKDGNIELLNYERVSTELQYPRDFRSVNVKQGLLLKITNPIDKTQSFAWFKNKKLSVIIPPTKDHITEFTKMRLRDDFYWIRENFNQLPEVKIKRSSENSKTMYISNLGVEEMMKAEFRKLYYKGADGEPVSGTLFMPLQYDPPKKYPVVVHIYEKQDYLTNRFLRPSFANATGFNTALLIASGFAVLLPDISNSEKGPGISALESLNNALDELQKIENMDMQNVGLMGQSFGGYETNFIATQSNRFAAYISGASVSDVIRTYYAFNENFNAPDYYRYEGGQNNYGFTLAENPQKYIANNPIMYAQNINAPMLLWAGKDDGNVSPEGVRSLYIALRKYQKPVIALFYEKERHSLSSLSAQKDLSLKVLDWFNYFLKEQKNIPWINLQMKDVK
ncbi:dipeptidyl aminopeptidase/acylaminoacyl peptidase [Epilithonimonas hungarica]|uniref:prolyl oligopeptidase family serine peptidase n=1 Tax=Epilithonimonas hungarica TaxID=454006 RepID=UPI0027885343|nr:prolyl oligopeptidase family serine peptidase [Epilithonimonas hungarica]MDP9955060.1 dipeptidyl aminopeptidase/acylaminoacyl peptidase [Epilithonimonas hungarica]